MDIMLHFRIKNVDKLMLEEETNQQKYLLQQKIDQGHAEQRAKEIKVAKQKALDV